MEHTATIVVSAENAETFAHIVSWFHSGDYGGAADAIDQMLGEQDNEEAFPAKVSIEVLPEEEPEIVLGCGFRFFGAPMAELEAVASQRRFEKPAQDWQEETLASVLEAMPDVQPVYEERPADPETGPEELDFVCWRLGNVQIDVV